MYRIISCALLQLRNISNLVFSDFLIRMPASGDKSKDDLPDVPEGDGNIAAVPSAPVNQNVNSYLKAELKKISSAAEKKLSKQMVDFQNKAAERQSEANANLLSQMKKFVGQITKKKETTVKPATEVSHEEVETAFNSQSDTEDEDDEDEEGDAKTEPFKIPKIRKHVPDSKQIGYFARARNMGPDDAKDDWTKSNPSKLVEHYTGHPSAEMFKAHDVDPELVGELKYESSKAQEKNLKVMEGIHGAASAAISSVMVKITDMASNLKDASIYFQDGSDEDPVTEAIKVLEDAQDELTKEIAPVVNDVLKLTASGFNKCLVARRKQFLDLPSLKKRKVNNRVQLLKPEKNKLFGGDLSTVAKALRDEHTVTIVV